MVMIDQEGKIATSMTRMHITFDQCISCPRRHHFGGFITEDLTNTYNDMPSPCPRGIMLLHYAHYKLELSLHARALIRHYWPYHCEGGDHIGVFLERTQRNTQTS